MPTGSVKWFNRAKGYGFISPDDTPQDAFVHITAVERAGLVTLYEGQRLSYELNRDRRGRAAAVNLTVLEPSEQTQPAAPAPPADAATTPDELPSDES